MTRPEEGRQEDRRAVEHEVVEAARKPAPFCRDCADQVPLGRCEHTGKLCDPYQAALERLRGPTYEDGLREAAEIARSLDTLDYGRHACVDVDELCRAIESRLAELETDKA